MRIRGALANYGKHAGGSVSGGMGYAQFHQFLTMLIEFKAKSEQERLGHPEDDSQRVALGLRPHFIPGFILIATSGHTQWVS